MFTSSSAHLYFTLLHRILNDIELCYHKQRGIYLWGEMRDVLRGIPCSQTQLCQPQTAVGLCTCTLGWAVSESIVGIVQGHARGIPYSQTQLCELQTTVGLCTCTLGWAVSESIVGRDEGHVKGDSLRPNTVV